MRFSTDNIPAAEKKYKSIIDNVSDVIFQTNAQGEWTFLNPAWTEVSGFSVSECLGQSFLNYIYPQDREQNLESFLQLMERKKEYCRHELRFLTQDDGYRWIEVHARLTLDEEGTITGTSGTLRDITGRKLDEQALLASEERIRQLQLAYELRRRSDFLNDLVNGITSVDERATALAGTLGIDLSRPLFCCLIYIAGSSGDGPKGDINHNLEMLRLKIIDGLSGEPDCTVWDCHDYIGVLYPLPEAAADERPANGMKTARRLRQKICGYAPEVAVILGVGGMQTGPKSLLKSFRQAWGAVISARSHSKGSAGIYHYRDLGINQLLAGCGGKEHAREFVEEQIGRLIVYDRQKGTDLLGTLEEILQSANLKEVAEKMFLHHKTIVSRKQRIEKILGIAIDQFEARLAIAAAIKLYRLNRVLQ